MIFLYNSALPSRPHSAFILRTPLPDSKKVAQSINQYETSQSLATTSPSAREDSKPLPPTRRRSDFVMRYEYLMNKAQKAMQTVDNYETAVNKTQVNETECKTTGRSRKVGSSECNDNINPEVGSDEDEVGDVDFNEEEVLQRCRNPATMQKSYDYTGIPGLYRHPIFVQKS